MNKLLIDENGEVSELTLDDFRRMKPMHELHPEISNQIRGSQKIPIKIPISIRLSPEVVNYFKSTGQGWQTRMDIVLQEYMASHGGK